MSIYGQPFTPQYVAAPPAAYPQQAYPQQAYPQQQYPMVPRAGQFMTVATDPNVTTTASPGIMTSAFWTQPKFGVPVWAIAAAVLASGGLAAWYFMDAKKGSKGGTRRAGARRDPARRGHRRGKRHAGGSSTGAHHFGTLFGGHHGGKTKHRSGGAPAMLEARDPARGGFGGKKKRKGGKRKSKRSGAKRGGKRG